jgi:hypothetical protein
MATAGNRRQADISIGVAPCAGEPLKEVLERCRKLIFWRPQVQRFDPQRFGEAKQFKICNPTKLGLKLIDLLLRARSY